MKKKVFAALLVLVLCLCIAVPAFAAEKKAPCVQDFAQLLTDEQEAVLTEKLEGITEKFSVELAVITVESCGDLSREEYAEDVYESCGYGLGDNQDGLLLLIDMDPENRGWTIYGMGVCNQGVGDDEKTAIGEAMTPFLREEEYADAFHAFADESEKYIDIAINGEPFPLIRNLIISFVVGLVIALIVTGIMKGKLKTVRAQNAAANYVRQGSMNVTQSNEIFLYRTVARRERPKSSNSGGSGGSGGSSVSGSF